MNWEIWPRTLKISNVTLYMNYNMKRGFANIIVLLIALALVIVAGVYLLGGGSPQNGDQVKLRTERLDEKLELAVKEYTRVYQKDVYSLCYEDKFGSAEASNWRPVYYTTQNFDFNRDGVDEIIVSGEACTSGSDITHVDAVFMFSENGSLLSIPFETNSIDQDNINKLYPEYLGHRLGNVGSGMVRMYSYHKPGDVGDDGSGRIDVSYSYFDGKFVSQAVTIN